jgi:hypothetical protein
MRLCVKHDVRLIVFFYSMIQLKKLLSAEVKICITSITGKGMHTVQSKDADSEIRIRNRPLCANIEFAF